MIDTKNKPSPGIRTLTGETARGEACDLPPPQQQTPPAEIPGELEMFQGKLTKVVDANRTGWWRFHQHYDRNGYCDNPGRGY